MKRNTQLYTAREAYDVIFHYKPIDDDVKDIMFDYDGYLHWTENGKEYFIDPYEVLGNFDMSSFEVCMVENNNGDDEYAMIMFEN